MKTPGKLYLIPCPISDLTTVIPENTRQVIKNTDYFLVENVRSARRYISSLKLGLKIEGLRFELLDKNSSPSDILNLLGPVREGRNAGIISEAGCPGVADPGSLAVKTAHKIGIQVIPLVGPSSILMALMGSGFSGQAFAFHGYLPIDKMDRAKEIRSLEAVANKSGQSQIFMETPYRNDNLLTSLLEVCQPQTLLCIATGINSDEESIKTNTIQFWRNNPIVIGKVPTIFAFGR